MIENIYKGSYNDMARKTVTSSEVKMRWMAENYKVYKANFRYDTDSELIDFIEANKAAVGTTQIIREALQMYIDSKK